MPESGLLPRERVDEFIDYAPCAFLSFDDNGTIELANRGLLNLLGYTREELQSLHIEKLLSVAGRIFYQTHFFPMLRLHGHVSEMYLALRTKTGEAIPVLVNASRRQRGDQYVNDCVLLTMLERRKFEDELLAARKLAEEALATKDQFLALATHELRAPLTAVLGWLAIARDSTNDQKALLAALDVVERNVQLESQLVGDILDYSRISSGKLAINVSIVDLRETLQRTIDVVKPAIDARKIRLSTIIDSQKALVSGDSNRLQQVFWNLLSNSVKFTPIGGRITISLRRAHSEFEVTITDSGEGIPADFLPFIFQRFQQADSGKSREHGGLGLGLSISKDIVELHGGSIYARSDGPGQGASFDVHLPVLSVAPEELVIHPEPEVENGQQRLAGLRVLVVDDAAESRLIISQILNREGAEVVIAVNATEAIEKLQTDKPDIMIGDIGMPNIDGNEMIRRIRALDSPTRLIPAIALTAHGSINDRIRALQSGFQAHLTKPVNPTELLLTLLNLAKLSK